MEELLGFINLHEKSEKVISLQFLVCGKRNFLRSVAKYPKRGHSTTTMAKRGEGGSAKSP